MMLPYIPFCLVEEILVRVPTEYLVRLRLVCREWNALFDDPIFIYKHLSRARHQFFLWTFRGPLLLTYPSFRVHEFKLDEIQHPLDIFYMVHCDGILLCHGPNCRLGVWNPCLSQFMWIKPSLYDTSDDLYGFGYSTNKSHGGYKILRYHEVCPGDRELHMSGWLEPWAEIYEFSSDTWRKLDFISDWSVGTTCKSVSLKGNSYWIAQWYKSLDFFIRSFDFSTETFRPLSFPPWEGFETIVLGPFRGEGLLLLEQCPETNKINVWVTKEIVSSSEELIWSRFMTVALPNGPPIHGDDEFAHPCFLIDENNKLVVCCEVDYPDFVSVSVFIFDENGFEEVRVDSRHDLSRPFIDGYVYSPSLVQLPHLSRLKPMIRSEI